MYNNIAESSRAMYWESFIYSLRRGGAQPLTPRLNFTSHRDVSYLGKVVVDMALHQDKILSKLSKILSKRASSGILECFALRLTSVRQPARLSIQYECCN